MKRELVLPTLVALVMLVVLVWQKVFRLKPDRSLVYLTVEDKAVIGITLVVASFAVWLIVL